MKENRRLAGIDEFIRQSLVVKKSVEIHSIAFSYLWHYWNRTQTLCVTCYKNHWTFRRPFHVLFWNAIFYARNDFCKASTQHIRIQRAPAGKKRVVANPFSRRGDLNSKRQIGKQPARAAKRPAKQSTKRTSSSSVFSM